VPGNLSAGFSEWFFFFFFFPSLRLRTLTVFLHPWMTNQQEQQQEQSGAAYILPSDEIVHPLHRHKSQSGGYPVIVQTASSSSGAPVPGSSGLLQCHAGSGTTVLGKTGGGGGGGGCGNGQAGKTAYGFTARSRGWVIALI